MTNDLRQQRLALASSLKEGAFFQTLVQFYKFREILTIRCFFSRALPRLSRRRATKHEGNQMKMKRCGKTLEEWHEAALGIAPRIWQKRSVMNHERAWEPGDYVQDTILKFWHELLKEPANPDGVLYTMLLNKMRTDLRKVTGKGKPVFERSQPEGTMRDEMIDFRDFIDRSDRLPLAQEELYRFFRSIHGTPYMNDYVTSASMFLGKTEDNIDVMKQRLARALSKELNGDKTPGKKMMKTSKADLTRKVVAARKAMHISEGIQPSWGFDDEKLLFQESSCDLKYTEQLIVSIDRLQWLTYQLECDQIRRKVGKDIYSYAEALHIEAFRAFVLSDNDCLFVPFYDSLTQFRYAVLRHWWEVTDWDLNELQSRISSFAFVYEHLSNAVKARHYWALHWISSTEARNWYSGASLFTKSEYLEFCDSLGNIPADASTEALSRLQIDAQTILSDESVVQPWPQWFLDLRHEDFLPMDPD